MLDKQITQRIYKSIFKKIKRMEVELFLCGGASTPKQKSSRDNLREKIQGLKNLAVYYPEDLFAGIIARKKTDLLTLERILADNSDVIMIICESPGSLAELGAFVNNSDTCGKVVAFIQSKYKNDKSFINQGPVEYLKKHSDRNVKVIYYNADLDLTKKMAVKALNETYTFLEKSNVPYDLNNISGQVCFMMLLLYFFDTIKYEDLRVAVREKYSIESSISEDEDTGGVWRFDTIYTAAIKRLHCKKYLVNREDLKRYQLSKNGYNKVKDYLMGMDLNNMEVRCIKSRDSSLTELENAKLRTVRDRYSHVDQIRLDVLRKSFYRHSLS